MEKKFQKKKELTKSSKKLGIKNTFEDLADNELDKYSNLKITQLLKLYKKNKT